jgi:hypothetical protein
MIMRIKKNEAARQEIPAMNTLTERVNKMTQNGYTDNMKVTKEGLYSTEKDKTYQPEEISIIDFFRFEGQSDPADNAILYVIETEDGCKGMLIDSYGAYADEHINKFITEVENINKKDSPSNAARDTTV